MYLNGQYLPWVKRIKYLGTIITNDFDKLEEDISSKRAKFIDNSNSLIQEFKYAHPSIKSAINTIYNGSVYGANLYNIESKMCQQLISSFNIATRAIWELPRETHKYICGELAGRHMLTNMITNKVGFYRRLESSSKPAVRNLFSKVKSDLRTCTGLSLRYVRNVGIEAGLLNYENDPLSLDIRAFRGVHRQVPVPTEERYRLSVLSELLSLKTQFSYFEENEFENNEIDAMIEDICVS